jgi:hypothetical protein
MVFLAKMFFYLDVKDTKLLAGVLDKSLTPIAGFL